MPCQRAGESRSCWVEASRCHICHNRSSWCRSAGDQPQPSLPKHQHLQDSETSMVETSLCLGWKGPYLHGAQGWSLVFLVEQSKLGTAEGCQALLPEHHTQGSPVPMAVWKGGFCLLGKCHGSRDADAGPISPPDAGEKQMRLFSILCCCAMAPALETLPTPFPLLLSMGVGTTICIVIYKLCRTLLGPMCINLGFASAFLFPLASLQHSFCLSCPSASLSFAESGVLFPRAVVCAAAMLICCCCKGRALGTSC